MIYTTGGYERIGAYLWSHKGDDPIMHDTKILHAVLEVTHVAEEIFRELFDGLYGWGGGDWRAAGGVLE